MMSKLHGFELEVTVTDYTPRVRVSNAFSGELVVDTDALSVTGIERMAAVFARAARMAYNELEFYTQAEHEKRVKRRRRQQ